MILQGTLSPALKVSKIFRINNLHVMAMKRSGVKTVCTMNQLSLLQLQVLVQVTVTISFSRHSQSAGL